MNTLELINHLSQIKNTPIRNSEDLKKLYDQDTHRVTKLSRAIERVYNCTSSTEKIASILEEPVNSIDQKFRNLSDIILSFGGANVIYPKGGEEDIDFILNRGQFWLDYGVKKVRGDKGRCHHNSSRLWMDNKDKGEMFLATGYALSEDGTWVQHSWCLLKNPRSVSVLETTPVKRVAYCGYVLTDKEANDFYFDHH